MIVLWCILKTLMNLFIKNFKPEVGKNIYLEAIQKDNTRFLVTM